MITSLGGNTCIYHAIDAIECESQIYINTHTDKNPFERFQETFVWNLLLYCGIDTLKTLSGA